MSMKVNSQAVPNPACCQALGRLFGRCIKKIRESKCQSLEETATLAGMESSEWAAIEAGHVPGDEAQLQSMAGALECHYDQIVNLALVCKGAWGL
jgi:transcriptional regulator with XRE-family HTH domain